MRSTHVVYAVIVAAASSLGLMQLTIDGDALAANPAAETDAATMGDGVAATVGDAMSTTPTSADAAAPPSGAGASAGSNMDPKDAGGQKPSEGSLISVKMLLEGRCKTAICVDLGARDSWLGIEPLVELPIGKTFSFNSGGLADYVNNTDVGLTFNAGLRVWIFQDWISFSIYLSQPLTPKDSLIRVAGSSFEYPASYVRRPYPGLGIGLLFDTLWIGIDRDELHNGSSAAGSSFNPEFAPNAMISGAWTFTVAIQPFTMFRTGIGTLLSHKEKEKDAEKMAEASRTDGGADGGG